MSVKRTAKMVLAAAMALGLAGSACEMEGKDKSDETKAEKDESKAKKKKKKSDDTDDSKGDTKAAKDDAKDDSKPGSTARAAADDSKSAEGDKVPDKPAAPVTDPSMQTYPDLPNKIADNCSKPFVIMATAPNSVGQDYPWTWTRQAMLANQQFKVVDGEPQGPGQVSFQLHLASDKFNNAWVLVAKCKDGGTCNKLAAMYKATLKNSPSQAVCGKLPMDLSPATFKKPVLREAGFSTNTLPEKDDIKGQCARLQACSVAMDPPNKAGKENIGFECQKAPAKVKINCARKYPCQEVMKCLEGG